MGCVSRQLLLDFLPPVGTPEVLKVIADLLVSAPESERARARSLIKDIALTLKPSKAVLQLLKVSLILVLPARLTPVLAARLSPVLGARL